MNTVGEWNDRTGSERELRAALQFWREWRWSTGYQVRRLLLGELEYTSTVNA
jgi:hypothetical protein